MSAQIEKLTAALAELEHIIAAEKQSMSKTIQQIKEQMMNLARQPTTSDPEDSDENNDEK